MKLVGICYLAFVVMAHAITWAQQATNGSPNTLAYENASIANHVYTNECFGISLTIPDGWHVNTQALGADGRARHTSKWALVLLMLDQSKEEFLGNTITLSTFDASLYDKTARELVSRYARGYVSTDRDYREIVKDTYSIEYAGKAFSRVDIKHTMRSGSVRYEAFAYTKFRGYYIGESLSASSPEGLDLAASSLQGVSFLEDNPNPKCVMVGDENPSSGGIIGVISSKSLLSNPQLPQRVRVSQAVSTGLLVTKVQPQYPDGARLARIQGSVVLQAEIDKSGGVEQLTLVSGHPMLVPAAIEAVKQWKYKPYLLNGQPVAVKTLVTVEFQLSGN